MRWTDIRLFRGGCLYFPKTVTAVSDLILQAFCRGKSHYAPCYCPLTRRISPSTFAEPVILSLTSSRCCFPLWVQSTFRIASPIVRTYTEFLLCRGISFLFSPYVCIYEPFRPDTSPITLVLVVTQGEHIPDLKTLRISQCRSAHLRASWLFSPEVASQNEVGTEVLIRRSNKGTFHRSYNLSPVVLPNSSFFLDALTSHIGMRESLSLNSEGLYGHHQLPHSVRPGLPTP